MNLWSNTFPYLFNGQTKVHKEEGDNGVNRLASNGQNLIDSSKN